MVNSKDCDQNSNSSCQSEITLIFRKFEGYILSGIGSRSVPVSRQAD